MALTNDRESKRSDGTIAVSVPKATTTIYGGSLCNRLTADGKVQPGGDTASTTFAGVAVRRAVSGASSVETYRTGEFEFTYGAGGATAALIGSEVCVNGEDTVDLAAVTTNDVKCGVIASVPSATKVRVVIDGYVK